MTQKPVLRAEVYARALRASQRGRKHNTSTPLYSKVETVHELVLKPDLSRFCVCFCIEESAPLFSLYVHVGRACFISLLSGSGHITPPCFLPANPTISPISALRARVDNVSCLKQDIFQVGLLNSTKAGYHGCLISLVS